MKSPIFLISLPRSGSTLLQRILTTHPQIESSAEPWILLPLAYQFKTRGVLSEYWHYNAASAIAEFLDERPERRSAYLRGIRSLLLDTYAAGLRPVKYFLDKTPRYHLILDQIEEIFPDAKFIVLKRNPLSIMSSMMKTWHAPDFPLEKYTIDFTAGIPNINSLASKQLSTCSLTYESLTESPQQFANHLFQFLQLDPSEAQISRFSEIEFNGRKGDPTGSKMWNTIRQVNKTRDLSYFCNAIRRGQTRRMLKQVSDDELSRFGYSLDSLLSQLNSIKTQNRLLIDFLKYTKRTVYCGIYRRVARRGFNRAAPLNELQFR